MKGMSMFLCSYYSRKLSQIEVEVEYQLIVTLSLLIERLNNPKLRGRESRNTVHSLQSHACAL